MPDLPTPLSLAPEVHSSSKAVTFHRTASIHYQRRNTKFETKTQKTGQRKKAQTEITMISQTLNTFQNHEVTRVTRQTATSELRTPQMKPNTNNGRSSHQHHKKTLLWP